MARQRPRQSPLPNPRSIFHALYYLPFANHSPAFTTVVSAIDQMPIYSICPRDYIAPPHPGYSYILSFAPLAPLDVYALAAHHDLAELAIDTSSHLLSHPLATIDDATATRIGPVYRKRLLSLHIIRLGALKDILLAPPHPHAPTKDCDFVRQKQLTRAWALVAAYLAWEARPGLYPRISPLHTVVLTYPMTKQMQPWPFLPWGFFKILFCSPGL